MKPSEVRQRFIEDHQGLRISLLVLRDLAGEPRDDLAWVTDLQKHAVELDRELRTHLDLEERHLVPVVLECLGEQAAADLSREHAEQRALLGCLLGRLREERPPSLLAHELHTLAELLLDDMAREEEELLSNASLWDDLSDGVASESERPME